MRSIIFINRTANMCQCHSFDGCARALTNEQQKNERKNRNKCITLKPIFSSTHFPIKLIINSISKYFMFFRWKKSIGEMNNRRWNCLIGKPKRCKFLIQCCIELFQTIRGTTITLIVKLYFESTLNWWLCAELRYWWKQRMFLLCFNEHGRISPSAQCHEWEKM